MSCFGCPYYTRETVGGHAILNFDDMEVIERCTCPNVKNGRHLCGWEDMARVQEGQA